MTTLINLIDNIDKSIENSEYVDLDLITTELGLEPFYLPSEQHELSAYYLWRMIDADTHIGGLALFLKDKFICLIKSTGRKSDKTFLWAHDSAIQRTKEYLISLMEIEQENYSYVDFDKDYGYGYPFHYGSELLTDDLITLKDKTPVTVFEKYTHRNNAPVDLWTKVKVKFQNGDIKEMSTNELLIPFCVKKD